MVLEPEVLEGLASEVLEDLASEVWGFAVVGTCLTNPSILFSFLHPVSSVVSASISHIVFFIFAYVLFFGCKGTKYSSFCKDYGGGFFVGGVRRTGGEKRDMAGKPPCTNEGKEAGHGGKPPCTNEGKEAGHGGKTAMHQTREGGGTWQENAKREALKVPEVLKIPALIRLLVDALDGTS